MPSSVIRQYSYNAMSHRLRIRFVSGTVYEYKGVPKELYEKFRSAISKGKFLNEEIKEKYPFEKIEEY